MGKLSTWVIIAENPYADIDMPEVPSEVPVGSGENISKSVCISRGKIVRVTVLLIGVLKQKESRQSSIESLPEWSCSTGGQFAFCARNEPRHLQNKEQLSIQ